MKNIFKLLLVAMLFNIVACCSTTEIDRDDWIAEDQSKQLQWIEHGDTVELVTPQGLTLWYNKHLVGDYQISYSVAVLMEGKEGDRLSDLNCFWAANDPKNPDNLFANAEWRDGIFKNYNTLNLFYVGYGGNYNESTRFRKYHGEFYGVDDEKIKPIIQEYADAANLLFPNKWLDIVITVKDCQTTYAVDGKTLFTRKIEDGEGDGYFGLRLLTNRIRFTGFKVEEL